MVDSSGSWSSAINVLHMPKLVCLRYVCLAAHIQRLRAALCFGVDVPSAIKKSLFSGSSSFSIASSAITCIASFLNSSLGFSPASLIRFASAM